MTTGPGGAILAVLMLASFALAGGGIWLIVRRHDRKRGLLMLTAAAVAFVNVLIWAVPGSA